MQCLSQKMTIGLLYVKRNSIDENPEYQRESAIWSQEKMQLLIDSLLNNYDIPKFYFHDIRGNQDNLKEYAIIDGKQRLTALFNFLENQYPTSSDLIIQNSDFSSVAPGSFFRDFDSTQKELFRAINLDISLVQSADEEDIEDLFSRLNNGEPLNAAERRNAIGGMMSTIIRDVARHTFFTSKLAFSNRRYNHYEIAAKLLLIENNLINGRSAYCDLKKRHLDRLVRDNRTMSDSERRRIIDSVSEKLNRMNRVFSNNDPLLRKQAYPPLYYLFLYEIEREYAHMNLFNIVSAFLNDFQRLRVENLSLADEERDPTLIEFSRLSQQGTNDLESLKTRISIMKRYFLKSNPSVEIRDGRRAFSEDERIAIWLRANKQCEICHTEIPFEEMDADHVITWNKGGSTSLDNARCLCQLHNRGRS